MKIMISVVMAAALMACGGKSTKSTTPDNTAGTTQTTAPVEGTGGTTYGGATSPEATPAAEAAPASAPAEAAPSGQ